jgi:hypothetical protein
MHAPRTSFRPRSAVLIATIALAAAPGAAGDKGEERAAAGRRSGNYLIVLAEAYAYTSPMLQFINTKTMQGFNVMTYVVPPGTTNATIKAHIQSLWGTPEAPDYILLVGDTDGDTSTATTIPHWTGQASRHACTDLPYACMDPGDDWQPEIPIGRFSVRSEGMLRDVVHKSLFVEAGSFPDPDYVKRAAFLATSDMTSGAEETHDWVIESFLDPAEFESTRIYQRLGGNTQDITNAVNNGCLFVTYGGHSGSGGWSGPAFNQSNVQALSNAGLYGLVFGWSCNTAHYSYDECFGETWQRVANRGAAAYLSASDYIYWGDWEAWEPSRQLERYFFKAFFVKDIWEVGPAWQSALYDFLADYGSNPAHEDVTRNFFEMMTLLGDPSLHLPEGIGFRLTVDPASQDLCSPPADEAVYTIEVEETMGFDEPVTLSASGEPPGSSVDFSVNSVPPPFTSVMTISNIIGGSPGEYSIEITGAAPSLQRSTFVDLNLSTELPGAVTLTSPPDGAIDVPRRPTLVWEPASQAVEYELEVATDAGFTNVVYSATVGETSHTVGSYLDTLTLHHWHVRANNGCGTSGYSEAFRFTTLEQADYFTEQFSGDFDLENLTVEFVPDGSGDYYRMCGSAATELPTDPSGGTTLSLSEDGYQHVFLGDGQTVSLYNVSYGSFYVCDNGYLTFEGADSTYEESLAVHFNQPRISALFDDLTAGGGTVSWKQLADRAVVTYEDVPEYGTGNDNTFQFEMFFNGEIHITWLNIDCADAIVGLSQGDGVPGDFIESDISAAGACGPDFELEADPVSQDVCAPADAVYTIHVIAIEGFSEPVTLSASGEPAGTNVGFSVNPVTPPGSSVMTISGTAGATPGQYLIEIIGSAAAIERSTFAQLNLSDTAPGVVTLTSPPDGALDVPLKPTLTWQPASDALAYDLEVATDADFTSVVYSATVSETSRTLDSDLDGATRHYWHVCGVNGCGQGAWSSAFSFTTLDMLMPSAYDMLNGETGTYTYFDDAYDGEGDNSVPLAPLSGGLGDLTDGVIATQNWNATPGPYVGWVSVNPTITFHFDSWVRVRRVTLYLDDSNGAGGVYPPVQVNIAMGDTTLELSVTDPPGGQPFSVSFDDLGLSGDMLQLTLIDNNSSRYMMLSEVEIYGGVCPGDLDGDADVDLSDLSILLANYGVTSGAEYTDGDLDGDGDVDLSDLSALLSLYGTSCE